MDRINTPTRITLAFVFALAMVVSTAFLQIKLHFNTYVALTVCLIVAGVFALISNGRK